MSAKTDLLDRLKYLDFALQSKTVMDDGIGITDHNCAAVLIRKGLGIVAFNILEEYIKAKTLETLSHISNSGIKYASLTNKLQEASTIGALKALAFRAKLEKKEGKNWLGLIHDESKKIYSMGQNKFEFSIFSFVSENSNISDSDITDLMKAFSIKGGWEKLQEVSNNISGGVANLNQSYKNAAERRNNAAHTANYIYEYSWLSNLKVEIISIATSLDILFTSICRLITSNSLKALDDHSNSIQPKYRFLIHEGEYYKEKTLLGGKSLKNWPDLHDAISSVQPKSIKNNEFLIILNGSARIIDWYC